LLEHSLQLSHQRPSTTGGPFKPDFGLSGAHLSDTLCWNAQWPQHSGEFVYFAGHLLAVLETATGTWNDMIWANGEKVAIAAGSATSGVLYELLDPLGSTAVVTGSGGQVEGTNVLPTPTSQKRDVGAPVWVAFS
jgi:hypothetical protein